MFFFEYKKRLKELHPENATELNQALIRIIIVSCVYFYLYLINLRYKDFVSEDFVFYYLYLFMGISAFTYYSILKHQPQSKNIIHKARRIITNYFDVFSIGFAMYHTGEHSFSLAAIYLWVTFGNGLRFGSVYLINSQIASILSFYYIIHHSPEWGKDQNVFISDGVLLMLIILPLYVLVLSNKLHKSVQIAKEESEKKTKFLAMMSHEIRTPLNGILGISKLLRLEEKTPRQASLIKDLEISSNNLMNLLNNILEFRDDIHNESPVRAAPYNCFTLKEIKSNTLSTYNSLAETKKIELIVSIPDNNLVFNGNIYKIQQVISNLVGNAIKFTENGSVSLIISQTQTNDYLTDIEFIVKDTGIGISKKDMDSVFKEFYQSDNIHDKYGGSGLGLSICKKIAKSLGGSITVDSKLGHGTTFKFSVPAIIVNDSELNQNKSNIQNNGISVINKINILICDDNRINNEILKSFLSVTQHDVTMSSSYNEMMDLLETKKFDLVITDLNLDESTGVEAYKLYRFMFPEDKQTKFAVLTADSTEETNHLLIDTGFDFIMNKPIDLRQLFSTVCSVDGSGEDMSEFYISKYTNNNVFDNVTEIKNVLDIEALNVLRQLAKGDQIKFMRNIFNNYVKDTNSILDKIEISLKSKDTERLEQHIHALKGNSLSVGAVVLSNQIKGIDKEVNSGKPLLYLVENEIDKFKKNVNVTNLAMNSYLESIAASS